MDVSRTGGFVRIEVIRTNGPSRRPARLPSADRLDGGGEELASLLGGDRVAAGPKPLYRRVDQPLAREAFVDAVAGVYGVVGEVVRVVRMPRDDVGGPRDEGGLGGAQVVAVRDGRGRCRCHDRRITSFASGKRDRGEQQDDGETGVVTPGTTTAGRYCGCSGR
ncbi:hypothetical protein WHI96_26620 [Pseudonocardia tropica]|uniref:Uncharacterized protein n=2 Tax=Pseudonocardia TaxID=1847 RepID=A0ABV1K2D7_9PSEU